MITGIGCDALASEKLFPKLSARVSHHARVVELVDTRDLKFEPFDGNAESETRQIRRKPWLHLQPSQRRAKL